MRATMDKSQQLDKSFPLVDDSVSKAYKASNTLSPTSGRKLQLPNSLRQNLEGKTGYSMDNIQLRESSQPESMGAKAFARGNVIDFAPGQFKPTTSEGIGMIGHEVGHVIQQAKGKVSADTPMSPISTEASHEASSDTLGASMMSSSASMSSMSTQASTVPSMSYSAAPVQGLFGGIKRAFRRAKQSYNFGKSRKAVDDFQGRELADARGEISAAQSGFGRDQAERRRMAELETRDARNFAASDTWGNLEADSRDAVGFDMEASDMNGFWSRLGRGTLFGRRKKEARLAQQAEDFRSTAIIDRESSQELDDLREKRTRASGSFQSAGAVRNQRSEQASDFFGADLNSISGGRDVMGFYQHGAQYEAQNKGMYSAATGKLGESGVTSAQVGSMLVGPYLDVINFEMDGFDPNNFDDCVQYYPAIEGISQKGMTISNQLKRHGRDEALGAMGLGESPDVLYQRFSEKSGRLGVMWMTMKRTLEKYADRK